MASISKVFKAVALSLPILAAAPAFGSTTDQEKGTAQQDVVPPIAYSSDGKQIRYIAVPEDVLKSMGIKLALSIRDAMGDPVILYDEQSLAKTPPAFQNFIFYHERAHHELGHTEPQNMFMQKFINPLSSSTEAAADCHGIKTLVSEKGYGAQQIKLITDTMLKEFAGTASRDNPASGQYNKQSLLYESASKRVEAIRGCANLPAP